MCPWVDGKGVGGRIVCICDCMRTHPSREATDGSKEERESREGERNEL